MSTNFTIIELPGNSRLKVATTDVPGNEDKEAKSPEWMVKIDSLTSSYVAGYNDFTQLYGWHGEGKRETGSDVSSTHPATSAGISHSLVTLIIPNAGYTATLETNMYLGKPLGIVSIVRLGNIMATKVKLQQIDFTICRISSLQQQLDRLIIGMIVAKKTNTIFMYDQDGGSKGQVVSTADFAQNIVE